MPVLEDAIDAIRAGDREEGRQILEEILETDESNEDVWLWLSSVVDTDEDREICLENVLALNPDNVVAQKGLEALRSGTFNVHNIMSEAIEAVEEEPVSETTFLDEFTMAGEADEELAIPGAKAKPGKKSTTGGLNIRIILLVAFVLCVVLALGSAAAYSLLSEGEGDDSQPSQEQPGQQGPVESEQPEASPTETLTPTETPTPTATNVPFQLPTAKPTEPPTPTATPVVSPTPR
jgi:hypothetical protein